MEIEEKIDVECIESEAKVEKVEYRVMPMRTKYQTRRQKMKNGRRPCSQLKLRRYPIR